MFCFNNIYRVMILYRDIFGCFCAAVLCSAAGGCVPSVPRSPCDEIRLYEWEICSDNRDDSGEISFKGDDLYMFADISGCKASVKGKCFIDNRQITVFAEGFDTLRFDYTLDGDKLLLSYFSKKLTFQKKI